MDISGGNIASSINNTLDRISQMGSDINTRMDEISKLTDSNDQQAAMIELNFQIGQYNAMMEMASSLTKNLTDSIKSIAQKI